MATWRICWQVTLLVVRCHHSWFFLAFTLFTLLLIKCEMKIFIFKSNEISQVEHACIHCHFKPLYFFSLNFFCSCFSITVDKWGLRKKNLTHKRSHILPNVMVSWGGFSNDSHSKTDERNISQTAVETAFHLYRSHDVILVCHMVHYVTQVVSKSATNIP